MHVCVYVYVYTYTYVCTLCMFLPDIGVNNPRILHIHILTYKGLSTRLAYAHTDIQRTLNTISLCTYWHTKDFQHVTFSLSTYWHTKDVLTHSTCFCCSRTPRCSAHSSWKGDMFVRVCICMYVWMFVHMHVLQDVQHILHEKVICLSVYVYVCICVWLYIRIWSKMCSTFFMKSWYVCPCMYMYVYVNVCIYEYAPRCAAHSSWKGEDNLQSIHVRPCMYVHVYVCICECLYIRIYSKMYSTLFPKRWH
jgi:hypothetical protein